MSTIVDCSYGKHCLNSKFKKPLTQIHDICFICIYYVQQKNGTLPKPVPQMPISRVRSKPESDSL